MPEEPLRALVVAAYALVALLAFRSARGSSGRERAAWSAIVPILLFLGAAKGLHIQENVTDYVRTFLHSQGWYAEHREVQAVAAALIASAAALMAYLLWRRLRGAAPSLVAGSTALGLLLVFIAVRTASIHDVDIWVTAAFAGMRKGWWVELAALLVIGGSALAYSAGRTVRR
jgi:hypothetical protein